MPTRPESARAAASITWWGMWGLRSRRASPIRIRPAAAVALRRLRGHFRFDLGVPAVREAAQNLGRKAPGGPGLAPAVGGAAMNGEGEVFAALSGGRQRRPKRARPACRTYAPCPTSPSANAGSSGGPGDGACKRLFPGTETNRRGRRALAPTGASSGFELADAPLSPWR